MTLIFSPIWWPTGQPVPFKTFIQINDNSSFLRDSNSKAIKIFRPSQTPGYNLYLNSSSFAEEKWVTQIHRIRNEGSRVRSVFLLEVKIQQEITTRNMSSIQEIWNISNSSFGPTSIIQKINFWQNIFEVGPMRRSTNLFKVNPSNEGNCTAMFPKTSSSGSWK